jgi:hypothetical protein
MPINSESVSSEINEGKSRFGNHIMGKEVEHDDELRLISEMNMNVL